MADLWMPGATRLDIGDHAPCDPNYPPKAIGHITWDKNATAAKPQDLVPYETLASYFGRNTAGKAVAPHILWDPFTGRFTQFVPADSRSKSVADSAGGTRTNRAGKVVIQIESLFFPYCRVNGKVYARLIDTPCLGWAQLNAWTRSHGIPDVWPMGRPTDFTSHRSEAVWETKGGWYGHSQVPENDHQDPGSWPAFTGAPVVTPPAVPAFPGRDKFKVGASNVYVTQLGKQLVKRGFGKYYAVGPGPTWGEADRKNVQAFQLSRKELAGDADGYPGPLTWRLLFS